MNPQDVVVTVLGAALIWGGVTLFKKFLDNRKEVRLAETKKESDREHLKTIQFMSEQETQRLGMLSKIISKQPQL